jgi:hypothetical protein
MPLRALVFTLFAATSLAAQAPRATYYPDKGQWERRAPAQVGMDAALVDSAIAFAKASESTTPRDLEAAHWASGFARESFPEPLGPFQAARRPDRHHRQARLPGGGMG